MFQRSPSPAREALACSVVISARGRGAPIHKQGRALQPAWPGPPAWPLGASRSCKVGLAVASPDAARPLASRLTRRLVGKWLVATEEILGRLKANFSAGLIP